MIPIRTTVPSRRFPLVSLLLVLANLAVFLFELALAPAGREALFAVFGLIPVRFARPEMAAEVGLAASPWPFLTYQFLHGGWLHLIMNMWSLLLFGAKVEDRMGRIRFIFFYLICGVTAAVTHIFFCSESGLPVIGASGAVAGTMGAYFMMYPSSRIVAAIPVFVFLHFIELPAYIYLGIWFLSQFFSGTASLTGASGCVGSVAFWTHVGGFVAGVPLLYVFTRRLNRQRPH